MAARRSTLLLLSAAVVISAPAAGAIRTTTTTYKYNVDGAPTAVTTQVDAAASTTIYLTWDNFVPDSSDPTAGSVAVGNGNLRGFGAVPGNSFATEFQYDQRDRLANAAAAGAQSVSYVHYPSGPMKSSTLASGDTLNFYYDVARNAQVTNIEQPSTATWSSYLAGNRYLSDGDEQVRLQPRKDVAGVYDPISRSFTAKRYEPFGGATAAAAAGPAAGDSAFDMRDNPFQYAGEYRDAAWGGYYLRARWYLPELQTFLQRDPVDQMHRYSYAGGNPITNTDPSGLSYAAFSRYLYKHFLHRQLSGAAGFIVPLTPIWGEIVGGMQLLAGVPQFWHHPHSARAWMTFGFMAASVATEFVGQSSWFDRKAFSLSGGRLAHAFGVRILASTTIGAGQAALASYHKGKVDVASLAQSIEFTAGGIFWGRIVSGFGYRPHGLDADGVDDVCAKHFAKNPGKGDVLVFEVREQLNAGGGKALNWTSPLLEARRTGLYHAGILAVGEDRIWYSEVGAESDGRMVRDLRFTRARAANVSVGTFLEKVDGPGDGSTFRYASVVPQVQAELAFGADAGGGRMDYVTHRSGRLVQDFADYHGLRNNCQDYTAGMLRLLRTH